MRGFRDEQSPFGGDHNRDLGALDAREFQLVGRIVEKAARAILFDAGGREVWVPKATILGSSQDQPGLVTLRVPEWWAIKEGFRFEEEACPGHVASKNDPKVCGLCGTHVDSLRPEVDGP